MNKLKDVLNYPKKYGVSKIKKVLDRYIIDKNEKTQLLKIINKPKCYKLVLPQEYDEFKIIPLLSTWIYKFCRYNYVSTNNGIPIIGPAIALCNKNALSGDSLSDKWIYSFDITWDVINSIFDNPNLINDWFEYFYNREVYFIFNDSLFTIYDKYTYNGELKLDVHTMELPMDYLVPVSYEEYLEKVMDTKIYTTEELEQIKKYKII